jgi:DNA-binding FadR family transcriptional regulator
MNRMAKPVLPSLQSKRLYRQIADLIAERIRDGAFAPGSYLPAERELAAQLGVSRPSVREALIALEVSGLVEIRPGSGVFVCQQPHASLAELEAENSPLEQLQARALVEGEIAALAALNASPEQLARLDATVAGMFESLSDPSGFHEADHFFHQLLAQASGSQTLTELVEYLWRQRYAPLYRRFEERYAATITREAMVEDHRAIVDAVRSGDANRARATMREHLEHVRFHFMK